MSPGTSATGEASRLPAAAGTQEDGLPQGAIRNGRIGRGARAWKKPCVFVATGLGRCHFLCLFIYLFIYLFIDLSIRSSNFFWGCHWAGVVFVFVCAFFGGDPAAVSGPELGTRIPAERQAVLAFDPEVSQLALRSVFYAWNWSIQAEKAGLRAWGC